MFQFHWQSDTATIHWQSETPYTPVYQLLVSREDNRIYTTFFFHGRFISDSEQRV